MKELIVKIYTDQSSSVLLHYSKVKDGYGMTDIHRLRVGIKNLRVLLSLIKIVSGGKFNKQAHNQLLSGIFQAAGRVRENQINHSRAESGLQPDDTVGTMEVVQVGNRITGEPPIVYDQHITRDVFDQWKCHGNFGLVPVVKMNVHHDLVQQVESDQPPDRRHPGVLIPVPAESLSDPLFVRQSDAGTVHGPESHFSPGPGREPCVENLGGKEEEIPEKPGEDQFTSLNKSAFGGRPCFQG